MTINSLMWPPTSNHTDQPPKLTPDQLEIMEAVWMTLEQARQQTIPEHLRRFLLEQS